MAFLQTSWILMIVSVALGIANSFDYGDIPDENFDGRIKEFDKIIKNADTLKAIAFSVDDKTGIYKQILSDTLDLLNDKSKIMKNDDTRLYAEYYKYIIKNVIKYTNKWLSEEVVQLIDKTNDKKAKNKEEWRKKRNIAEFIYYKSGDYGVDLLLNNQDTTFDNYFNKKSIKLSHEEL